MAGKGRAGEAVVYIVAWWMDNVLINGRGARACAHIFYIYVGALVTINIWQRPIPLCLL